MFGVSDGRVPLRNAISGICGDVRGAGLEFSGDVTVYMIVRGESRSRLSAIVIVMDCECIGALHGGPFKVAVASCG